MKKITYVLTFLFIALSVNGFSQIRGIDTDYDKVISDGKTAYFITGSASDTTGTLDSTLTKTWFVNTNDETIADIYVEVDSTGGTSSVANAHYFILQYKEFPDQAYTNIDTVTYFGTVDTTFNITSTSAYKARYWRLLEKGKTDELKTELQKAYLKLWK